VLWSDMPSPTTHHSYSLARVRSTWGLRT